MNIAVFAPWIFVSIILMQRRRRQEAIKAVIAAARKGKKVMNSEVVRRFIGKKCDVSTLTNGLECYHMTVVDVTDNWLILEEKGAEQVINLEYVSKIVEIKDKAKKND
ncbi:MAG: hypothetical protein J6N70_03550 [Oribacterium sp.]|nr:hypothetical protein [Oribacterium sp.]MBQ5330743.1 hypothetical protein [Oscillospiraceae bacterium]